MTMAMLFVLIFVRSAYSENSCRKATRNLATEKDIQLVTTLIAQYKLYLLLTLSFLHLVLVVY